MMNVIKKTMQIGAVQVSVAVAAVFGVTSRIAHAQVVNQFTGHTGGNWGSFREIINSMGSFLSGKIIPLIVSLALIAFIWNMIRFISSMGDPKTHEQFRKYSINALLALFIMLSVWGIVAIGTRTLFGGDPVIPQLPTSPEE